MNYFTKQIKGKNEFSFIVGKLRDYQIKSNDPNVIFAARYLNTRVQIFNTFVLLVQGKNVDNILQFLGISEKPITIKNAQPKIQTSNNISYIGCDEAGTGDTFGGIVCTACYIHKDDVQWVKSLGITDSKKLNDAQIFDRLKKLEKENQKHVLNIRSFSVNLSPKEYNKIYNQLRNDAAVKAYCHNMAITNLLKKLDGIEGVSIHKNTLIVMDQFVPKQKYYEYLKKAGEKIEQIDISITKAESKYIAVALASMTSRKKFVLQMNKLSKELGEEIPLGSSSNKVNDLLSRINKNSLHKFAKLSFSNVKKFI